nr:MAG TPA: hypothetical protein [Caudoviricetes sp.]
MPEGVVLFYHVCGGVRARRPTGRAGRVVGLYEAAG